MRKIISKKFILLLLLILLGAVFRFYRLSDFPVQLNNDEVSQLYDAISIAQTGRDIYGNFLPFIFSSVGDFKPPFYTYITGLFYMISGWQEATVRLPAALFGLLTVPAVYFFTLKLLKRSNIALLSAFLTSIAPFEIFFSRKSFENGAGIFLMLIGFSCLFLYMEKKRLIRVYFAAAILAAAMYTYFSHAIIVPVLLAAFILIFKEHFISNFKKVLGPFLFFAGLILPLFLLILMSPGARFRTQTVFIKQDVNLGRELGYVGMDSVLAETFLKNKITVDYIFNRYLRQFDPAYLFGSGLDFTNLGFLGTGPLFLMELLFLLMGIVFLIKNHYPDSRKKFIAVWIILGMLPSGLTFESHSPHRAVMVFTMLDIISAAGLYWFFKLTGRNKFFKAVSGALIFAFGFSLVYFIHMYFVNFPFEKSQYIQYPFKQVAEFAWSQYNTFDAIVFDPKFGDIEPEIGTGAHYYFAYFGRVPPAKFQKDYHVGSKPREILFDKFSIREVYWPADKDLKDTLLIVSPWSVPEGDIADKSKIIKRFYFYNGKQAFYAVKL